MMEKTAVCMRDGRRLLSVLFKGRRRGEISNCAFRCLAALAFSVRRHFDRAARRRLCAGASPCHAFERSIPGRNYGHNLGHILLRLLHPVSMSKSEGAVRYVTGAGSALVKY